MYEPHRVPPIPFPRFIVRMLIHAAVALAMIAVSLLAGIGGYIHYEHLPTRDAFLNAAMLLGGMGPVETRLTEAGKVFAGLYALYSGLFFIAVMGVILAPVLHRLMHTLHWEDKKH
jgi:hypothetical protein